MARKPRPPITDARFGDRNFFKDKGTDEVRSRQPYRQHPDTDEVDRFMAHDNPVEFLQSSVTRSAHPDPDDRYSVMAEASIAPTTLLH